MSRFSLSRVTLLQIALVMVFFAPWLGVGLFVALQHKSIESQLADMEPRYARLLGLSSRKSELIAASLSAKNQLKRAAYSAEQTLSIAGNEAQQRIRALFADSRLNVISIQVLPVKAEDGFDRIPIELKVEGDLTGIQNALALLMAQQPQVFIDDVALQTIGAVRPASIQLLGGQFLFSVLRAQP